ncbi:hypothetical protein J3E74DRAFT_455845 [Bipolaris maydis]|nr:hypothetical protein J3E74DRAFT_455845 [Bipolaris maydis]
MTASSYKPQSLSSTPKSVVPADLLLLRVDLASTQHQQQRPMAHDTHRPSPLRPANELWYNIPASASQHQEEEQDGPELSAYQATAHRLAHALLTQPRRLRSPPINKRRSQQTTTTLALKFRKKTKQMLDIVSGLLRREPPRQLDSTLLQPEPYQPNQRHSTDLSVETHVRYSHIHSRSMPNSPRGFCSVALQQRRKFAPDSISSYGFLGDLPLPAVFDTATEYGITISAATYGFFRCPPRNDIAPNSHLSRPNPHSTPRDAAPSRPRPHTTYLSPTEPFTDMSQFHLFAEAMTGLQATLNLFSQCTTTAPRFTFRSSEYYDSIPLPCSTPRNHPPHQCDSPSENKEMTGRTLNPHHSFRH